MPTPAEKRATLRSHLASGEMVVAAGVFDSLSAKLAQEMGFKCASLGGMSTGASALVPEALLTMSDQADAAARIDRVIDIPLSVDGHGGFGDVVHTMRTIREFEHAGVATVSIEDQISPARVSYFRNIIHVTPRDEFITKLRYAVQARQDPSMIIMGRTDSYQAVEGGREEAVERGKAMLDAGVDMLYFRGPREAADLEHIAKAFPDTPKKSIAYGNLPAKFFRDLGFSLIAYPTSAILVAYEAVRKLFEELRDTGEVRSITGDHYWDVRKKLYRTMGIPALWKIESDTVETIDEPTTVLPATFMTETD